MKVIIGLLPAKTGDIQRIRDRLSGALEAFSRKNSSRQGLHNDFSRHRFHPDDVPSSKEVQPDSDRACSSSHNGGASKRLVISSSRSDSSGESSEIRSSQLVSSSEDEENDEYYDYADGEDEEMWLIKEKSKQKQLLRQQEVDANNVKKGPNLD